MNWERCQEPNQELGKIWYHKCVNLTRQRLLKQLFEGQKRFLKGFFCKILAGWYAKIEISLSF
jgi:hypothetical protein